MRRCTRSLRYRWSSTYDWCAVRSCSQQDNRVCGLTFAGRFDYELNNAIFQHKLGEIRRGHCRVDHILPLVKRQILRRFGAGTLDRSDFVATSIDAGALLQDQYGLFRGLDKEGIFSIFLDIAMERQNPDRAIPKVFDEKISPSHDPEQIKAHAFFVAAYLGELEVVRSLLSEGVHPGKPSIHLGFALSAAARAGNNDIVRLLLDNGAQVCTGEFPFQTAILTAAKAGHEHIIQTLLEPQYEHPTSGKIYKSAILESTKQKLASTVFLLLDRGTAIYEEDVHAYVFLEASSVGCLPLVKAMVERGETAHRESSPPEGPLVRAAEGGHADVVSYLLAEEGRQDVSSMIFGDPITIAAARGHIDTARVLIEHSSGMSGSLGTYRPVCEAAKHNRVDMVRYLLQKGAELGMWVDNDEIVKMHYNALKWAVQRGWNDVMVALAEGSKMGIKITPPEFVGSTYHPPLIIQAKMWNQADTVALLLTLGLDDIDPLQTVWAEDFRKGVYPKSSATLMTRRSG